MRTVNGASHLRTHLGRNGRRSQAVLLHTGNANFHMRGSGKLFPALARSYAEVGDNTASSCSMSAKPFGNSPAASFTWPLAL
jgi:hypothetical protein